MQEIVRNPKGGWGIMDMFGNITGSHKQYYNALEAEMQRNIKRQEFINQVNSGMGAEIAPTDRTNTTDNSNV